MAPANEILDYPIQKPIIKNKLLYKNSSSPNSFQEVMKKPLVVLQLFGFFPVSGITKPNYRNLKFTWKSFRLFFNLICLFGIVFHFVCFCVKRKLDKTLAFNAAVFQVEGIILSGLFIYLAKQWPDFVKEWHLVEVSMRSYELTMNLKRKIWLVSSPILTLAIIEHSMVIYRAASSSITQLKSRDFWNVTEMIIADREFSEIFETINYSFPLGLYFMVLNIQKTFIWTYLDVFIIIVSVCFNFRLKQVSKRLYYISKIEVTDENIWRTVREDYVKLTKLCESINNHLCWFVLISYSTNIYHILSQLFSSLRPIEDIFSKVYFYVSFFLLILRVTSVCVFGGSIFDQHEEITRIMTTVPSAAYNIEVERFVMHLATYETALTGKNFFKITRNLILKVTSAIVTYELVLIQFNQNEFKTKDL
ncbi:gustatory receptor for sugar taste 64f-like [Anthonomus grandis grandis]|uniref:gustatory receptor for sugar taste 64f-like n=1 Tax=Anthonomus grandis grandis TaxID=2921223 RepID=UPI0021659BE7|nr:gustatory receptor for sugar taste 64f-like [Anthonomus grandis grandis]